MSEAGGSARLPLEHLLWLGHDPFVCFHSNEHFPNRFSLWQRYVHFIMIDYEARVILPFMEGEKGMTYHTSLLVMNFRIHIHLLHS